MRFPLSRSIEAEWRTWRRSRARRNQSLLQSLLGRRDQSVQDRLLTGPFAPATLRLGSLPRVSLRWLFIEPSQLHLPERAFSLHLSLQSLESLVDVVIADEDLQTGLLLIDIDSTAVSETRAVETSRFRILRERHLWATRNMQRVRITQRLTTFAGEADGRAWRAVVSRLLAGSTTGLSTMGGQADAIDVGVGNPNCQLFLAPKAWQPEKSALAVNVFLP
jgi:hypothetical protein